MLTYNRLAFLAYYAATYSITYITSIPDTGCVTDDLQSVSETKNT